MKKTNLICIFLFISLFAVAQKQADYNQKGDSAMLRLDYSDAKIWYEEGVSRCDMYSINKLTSIWLANDSMRMYMNSVMSKCLSCLNDRATEQKDTTSIKKLILYYTNGIGIPENEATADFWKSQLEFSRNRNAMGEKQKKRVPMQFFAGYTMSTVAPLGLTFGGIGKTLGWYARFRTNMSFQSHTEECDEGGTILDLDSPHHYSGTNKNNTIIVTGGAIIKAARDLYVSLGAGYAKREVVYKFEKIGITEATSEGFVWAKHADASFSGLAIDLDAMFRVGKNFYASAGCGTMGFKHIYANAGIGVFF